MNINSKNFDQIEAYLFNQMTDAEKNAFEAKVSTDTDLAKELKLQKAEHHTMQLMLREKLRGKMNKWQSEVKTAAPKEERQETKVVKMNTSRKNRIFKFSIAASILLLIGVFTNLWVDNNLSDAALAESYFSSTYTARKGGNTPNISGVLAPGLVAMDARNFTKAVELFSQVTDGNYRETALILKGESYFQLKEYQNAADVFKEVVQDNTTPLNVEKAEWKLLLSNLRLGKTSKVESLKNEILNNQNHSFYPSVLELSKKQDNLLKQIFDNLSK